MPFAGPWAAAGAFGGIEAIFLPARQDAAYATPGAFSGMLVAGQPEPDHCVSVVRPTTSSVIRVCRVEYDETKIGPLRVAT
jgi:hypothetical protein